MINEKDTHVHGRLEVLVVNLLKEIEERSRPTLCDASRLVDYWDAWFEFNVIMRKAYNHEMEQDKWSQQTQK